MPESESYGCEITTECKICNKKLVCNEGYYYIGRDVICTDCWEKGKSQMERIPKI